MEFTIEVRNVKCGGCARTIEKGLSEDARIEKVAVDVAAGRVTVTAATDVRAEAAAALARLGYPEKG